jgi:HAE1 family hydrophobic/amphiphilic exporter-1
MGVVLFGLFSMIQIPKESQPDIDVPVVFITTTFPGANAQDVEQLITDEFEERLEALENLDEMSSTSSNGISTIALQFDVDEDSDKKLADVKDVVDLVKPNLPTDANDPIVQKLRFTDIPILTYAISGPYSAQELKRFAENIESELSGISGISEIQILGGQERQIQVLVQREKLQQYSLSIDEVTNAVRQANSEIPVGTVETENEIFTINFTGTLDTIQDISLIPVAMRAQAPILLSDVAEIRDTFAKKGSESRIYNATQNRVADSVSMRVYKTSGGNILDIEATINERVAKYREVGLPDNVSVDIIENNAQYIRKDLANLTQSGAQTVLIVFLVLILFVGFREALLAAFAIPLTFVMTFIFLQAFGFTLNFLTLFSLILSLGILVDGAIVMTEGIFTFTQKGQDVVTAAKSTLKEFTLPLASGTMTTVFAFVPMLMASGILGKFIRTIPITVSVVLFASLFVSLGFITTLARFIIGTQNKYLTWLTQFFARFNISDKVIGVARESYEGVFQRIIESKFYTRLLWGGLTVLFIGSLALPISGFVKVEMFPQSDMPFLYIDYSLPTGTKLEVTSGDVQKIEDVVQQYHEDNELTIDNYVVTIGSSAQASSTASTSSNIGSLIVNLVESEDGRVKHSSVVLQELENELKQIEVLGDISVSQQTNGPDTSAPVSIQIAGSKLEVLDSIGKEYEDLLKSFDGTRNVSKAIADPVPELVFEFDRMKGKIFGVSANQVALTLRNAITGIEASTLRTGGESTDIIVKYDFAADDSIDLGLVEGLTVKTNTGEAPITDFIDIGLGAGRRSIRHIDAQRTITVSSDVMPGTTAIEIFNKLSEGQSTITIPDGYSVKFGGEQEDLAESLNDMFRAMILGILLIAALLVLQFNSFKQPLYILATIPLALIGVFPGLLLIDLPLSFPGIIGVVALVGIVVNNAIILVDRINYNRAHQSTLQKAVTEATSSRFQPILLTTMTTVLGLLPLALTDEGWGPLGYTIIFGLTFSTVLTLVVIPLLYYRFEKGSRDSS